MTIGDALTGLYRKTQDTVTSEAFGTSAIIACDLRAALDRRVEDIVISSYGCFWELLYDRVLDGMRLCLLAARQPSVTAAPGR